MEDVVCSKNEPTVLISHSVLTPDSIKAWWKVYYCRVNWLLLYDNLKSTFPYKENPNAHASIQSYYSTAVVASTKEMRTSHRTSLQGIVQWDHFHSASCHQTQGLEEHQTGSLCACGRGLAIVSTSGYTK